jgi:hypothetical protein
MDCEITNDGVRDTLPHHVGGIANWAAAAGAVAAVLSKDSHCYGYPIVLD